MLFRHEDIPLMDAEKQKDFINRVKQTIILGDCYNEHDYNSEKVISLSTQDLEENKVLQDQYGLTFLDFAVSQGKYLLAFRFLNLGMKFNHSGLGGNPRFYAQTNEHANRLFGEAISGRRADIVKILLSQGVDPNTTKISLGDSPLDGAIISGSYETVEVLINHPRTNFLDRARGFGQEPIVRAYGRGEIEMVKLLLSKGAKLPEYYQAEYLLKYPEPDVNQHELSIESSASALFAP